MHDIHVIDAHSDASGSDGSGVVQDVPLLANFAQGGNGDASDHCGAHGEVLGADQSQDPADCSQRDSQGVSDRGSLNEEVQDEIGPLRLEQGTGMRPSRCPSCRRALHGTPQHCPFCSSEPEWVQRPCGVDCMQSVRTAPPVCSNSWSSCDVSQCRPVVGGHPCQIDASSQCDRRGAYHEGNCSGWRGSLSSSEPQEDQRPEGISPEGEGDHGLQGSEQARAEGQDLTNRCARSGSDLGGTDASRDRIQEGDNAGAHPTRRAAGARDCSGLRSDCLLARHDEPDLDCDALEFQVMTMTCVFAPNR